MAMTEDMEEFKDFGLEDREIAERFILPSGAQDCDLSFANLCSWHFLTGSSYAIVEGMLVVRFAHARWGHVYFLPLGEGGQREAEAVRKTLAALKETAARQGERLCLRGETEEIERHRGEWGLADFQCTEERDLADYIYRRQDLAELKGKHYQAKRNHVNKFRREYDFEYKELEKSDIEDCLAFEASWCQRHQFEEDENIRNEREAMRYAFAHWEALGLRGGVIRVEGEVAAFTFGAPIGRDTFGVHFEKADIHVDGSYSVINQFFAASLPEEFLHVNREEDLGIPGLRQAKLSYNPEKVLMKTEAVSPSV